MTARQLPAADRFVVRCDPRSAASARESLFLLGDVEPVAAGREDLLLLYLRPRPGRGRSRSADARSGWRLVLESAPDLVWAAPVLLDETGAAHVPTGGLAVRFLEAPAPAALARFASRHRLSSPQANAFVPSQVRFEPAAPRESYLPELVEGAAHDEAVAAAWAETLSRYRRL